MYSQLSIWYYVLITLSNPSDTTWWQRQDSEVAGIHLQPPVTFKFHNPDDWPCWKSWLQQFRKASGLADVSAGKQVSTLLYCLGEEAEAVLSSMNPTQDNHKDYGHIVGKFDEYFKVRKNVRIYKRAWFNKRNQQSGESAE